MVLGYFFIFFLKNFWTIWNAFATFWAIFEHFKKCVDIFENFQSNLDLDIFDNI